MSLGTDAFNIMTVFNILIPLLDLRRIRNFNI